MLFAFNFFSSLDLREWTPSRPASPTRAFTNTSKPLQPLKSAQSTETIVLQVTNHYSAYFSSGKRLFRNFTVQDLAILHHSSGWG